MSNKWPTKEQFEKDVSKHKLSIIKDDGLYREIECGEPGTGNMRFRIITYPGGLLYTGDMGTYVFERLEDMFSFFRQDDINSSYWAEKCVAESVYGNGIRKFDADEFRGAIKEHFDIHFEDSDDEEDKKLVWDEIQDQILDKNDEEWSLVSALQEFYIMDNDFEFTDFWNGFTSCVKTYHYIWCLYAIVYAIKLYDKEKSNGN